MAKNKNDKSELDPTVSEIWPDVAADITAAFGENTFPESSAEEAEDASDFNEDTAPEQVSLPTDAELLAAERDMRLRLAAEYENFRRRTNDERKSLYGEITASAVAKFLPVYDNLQRAVKTPCADESYAKGVDMILQGLISVFTSLGVTEIPSVGEKFDPNRHNAVMHVDNPEFEEQVITEEFEKGFEINGKIIRHALVAVAN